MSVSRTRTLSVMCPRVCAGVYVGRLTILAWLLSCGCVYRQAMLVYVANDDTMDILCDSKLHRLSVQFRAAILDGLQKAGHRPGVSRWVRQVLLGTRGHALTSLKCLVDDGGDIRTWCCVGAAAS